MRTFSSNQEFYDYLDSVIRSLAEGGHVRSLDVMRKVSITTEIAAPAERGWQVMSDTDRWHEWTPSVTSIKRLGGGPFAVGRRAVIRQPKFPPAIWKIAAIEPLCMLWCIPGFLRQDWAHAFKLLH